MPDTLRTRAEAIVARQQFDRDHWRQPNALSGLSLDPPSVETVETVMARLERQDADARAFRASPRGRFLAAISELEELGWYEEADRLRGLYNRSITTLNGERLSTNGLSAIGAALVTLEKINHSTAREAASALGELLLAEGQMARAA